MPELKLPDSLDRAAQNLTDHPTKNIGQTIGDLWFLVFGGITQAADKKRLRYAQDLETFKEELEEKVSAIPPEKLIEPSIQVIGPALEDAKYCAEHHDLRSMFSNLIASALNIDTAEGVHPSFSSILRQISPLDAQNIKLFAETADFPVASYLISYPNKKCQEYFYPVFLSNPEVSDIERQSISIHALCRAGLLFLRPKHLSVDYDAFYKTVLYQDLVAFCDSTQLAFPYPNPTVKVEESTVSLTALGRQFVNSCVEAGVYPRMDECSAVDFI